jgi:prolyl oligopeptidase
MDDRGHLLLARTGLHRHKSARMKSRLPGFAALAVLLAGCATLATVKHPQLVYPVTRTTNVVDNYHGTEVTDAYRWLEDDNSAETKAWVEAQNQVTYGYLETLPLRAPLKQRMTALYNFERFGVPSRQGGRYFFQKNDGLQNQSVLYVAESLVLTGRNSACAMSPPRRTPVTCSSG